MLYIVGLGLSSKHLTRRALEVLSNADIVFLEKYTSLAPDELFERVYRVAGGRVVEVCRRELEDENAEVVFKELEKGLNVALAVIGDPFIATTHNYIRIEALRRGFKVEYVPGINIYTYAASLTGLFIYKFGGSATIVYPRKGLLSKHPYLVLKSNYERGLHTFFFLDLSEEEGFMKPDEAVKILKEIEKEYKGSLISNNSKIVVLERLGFDDEHVYYTSIGNVLGRNWGKPPYSIIYPGKLHFMEEDSLELFSTD